MSSHVPSVRDKVVTIRDLVEKNKAQIQAALPKHMSTDRMVRVLMTSVQTVPRLIDCTPRSLLAAVIQCSQLGLEPGILGHVYLVPFRNRKSNTTEVQVIPGYKGLLLLARRSGEISTIQAHVVRHGDKFSYSYGLNPMLMHTPSDEPAYQTVEEIVNTETGETRRSVVERPITHFYAIAKLKDGGVQFEVMTKRDVDAHRDRYSRAAQDGPWVTNYDQMGLKTVLRQLGKLLPASIELQTGVTLSERAEVQIPQDLELPEGVVAPEDESAPEANGKAPTAGQATLDKLAETVGGAS